ncbi:hypothetical protein Tco_0653054 [Tanacetum coccineum]|uniref:Gag protein n=1 Tax=Tanacetum coccineum TaxID=301880 RepID=A0ABQ4X031_9ASTR
MKCQPLFFKGTEAVVDLTQWFERMETVFRIKLALLSEQEFAEETDKIERYVGGMPDSIYSSVVASKPKTMQEAIEWQQKWMDRRNKNTLAERTGRKQKGRLKDTPTK